MINDTDQNSSEMFTTLQPSKKGKYPDYERKNPFSDSANKTLK